MKELKKAGQGSGNFKKKHGGNGERKQRVCKNTNKYCWSHGHAHTKTWSAAGRIQDIRTTQPLEKRKTGYGALHLTIRNG